MDRQFVIGRVDFGSGGVGYPSGQGGAGGHHFGDRPQWTEEEVARACRFKLSDMDGHEHGEKRETILTTHDRHYVDAQDRTRHMCLLLKTSGFELIRYKIEHVLIDSRVNDTWELIDA